jgi:hypothetical protein
MDYRSQTETKTQNVTTYANGNGGRGMNGVCFI